MLGHQAVDGIAGLHKVAAGSGRRRAAIGERATASRVPNQEVEPLAPGARRTPDNRPPHRRIVTGLFSDVLIVASTRWASPARSADLGSFHFRSSGSPYMTRLTYIDPREI